MRPRVPLAAGAGNMRCSGALRHLFDVLCLFSTQLLRITSDKESGQGPVPSTALIMMKNVRIIVLLFCAVLSFAPSSAHAGFGDILSRAAGLWKGMSIGALAGETDPAPEPSDEPSEEPGVSTTPGLCQVPQEPVRIECEIGAGFLCVSTPPGSVAQSSFVLKGAIDRQSSVLASITISAQNEYTKKGAIVDTSSPASSGCWDAGSSGAPFCLDAEGRFSATVDLPEAGPYTISVAASRVAGNSEERSVRLSRVVAPALTSGGVTLDPDVKTLASTDLSHVRVSVSLLGECQFCDFIGAATNGVTVSVENVIEGEDGNVRRIECASTVEQGGQGKFTVGVPVGAGQNSLVIKACNAATGASCPSVGPIAFTGTGAGETVDGITFISPEPMPSYDSGAYPSLPWKFRIAGETQCVDVRFNRLAPISVCPDAQGAYSLTLNPRTGINVATIASEGGMEEYAWTFGWGKILSPHASGDGAMDIPSAIEVALPEGAVRDILLPLINNFLASDERDELISEILSGMDGGDSSSGDSEAAEIPKCSSAGIEGFSAKLRGEPSLGEAVLKGLEFKGNGMALSASLKDLEIGIDLVPEKDLPPLPLIVSFRKALADLSIEDGTSSGEPLVLLSSPHDDCDYKAASYCNHIPAALVPENLVGGANSWGGFVKCDMDLAEGKAKEACAAINSLNAQTGVINEKVLDAVNQAIYCGGSSALTGLVKSGIDLPAISIGSDAADGLLPKVSVPLRLMLDHGLGLSNDGMLLDASLSVGSDAIYAHTPAEALISSAGVIKGAGFGAGSFTSPSDAAGDLAASLSLDAVGAFVFAATAQGDGRAHRGLLDIDLHEPFFKEQGFDFIKECDEYVVPEGGEDERSVLCYIRPRVLELLGTSLTTYGYFKGNQPLIVAVRANRALGARIAAVGIDEVPVVANADGSVAESGYVPSGALFSVELGGVTLSFYAVEIDQSIPVDQYGNLTPLLDSDGRPVIFSMRPDDPDPWNGQIISFDLTLLAAIEVGEIGPDTSDASKLTMPFILLSDRTRLVITPISGTNATTVPALSLVSQLSDELSYALAGLSGPENTIMIPIPREFDLTSDEDNLFGKLGLANISFGAQGIYLETDTGTNSITAAITAVITQILHIDGKSKTFRVPN